MDHLLAKQDLSEFSRHDLNILKSHFRVKEQGDDSLWLLAISIINSIHKAHMIPAKFKEVLGAGGFGIIIKEEGTNVVGKFLTNASSCREAEVEYYKHLTAYNAFKSAVGYPQLCISRPIDFGNRPVKVMNKEYSCYYLMTELYPVNKNGLYHIINEDYQFNRILGREYNEPVSETNPPRGFFATYSYIQRELLDKYPEDRGELIDISTLINYMGYSFGLLLFEAKLLPRDVEYTLGRTENGQFCFTVLDFGMTEYIDFSNLDKTKTIANSVVDDILNIDIYFPVEEDEIIEFKKGLTEAYYMSAYSKGKELLYQTIMKEWE